MHRITILPPQAERISQEAAKTGGAIGVSQTGSILTLYLGKIGSYAELPIEGIISIDAQGHDIHPPDQEQPC